MSKLVVYASRLGPCAAAYICLKQALGRQFHHERDVLAHIDRFLAAQMADLTPDIFASWCTKIGHLSKGVRRNWMRIVRNFCLYRQRSEPGCFVPDPNLFPQRHDPIRPHLFNPGEIARLLRAANNLRASSTSPLHSEVFRLAITLLYTAGLRRGELSRLTLADYDHNERTLMICESKYHKSRLVPLSSDAVREMERYLTRRQRFICTAETPLLYRNHATLRPYTGAGLAQGLRRLFQHAGIRTATGKLPRVHDLRHSFAHQALLRWYCAGIDVQAKLPALAAYMGHVSIFSTQYYLSFFEPFAQAASERFMKHCSPFLHGDIDGGDL